MADLRGVFLDAIRDAPEDDVPRLIFADWLDDHGEPERAEFIRAQIDLSRGPNYDPEKRQRVEDLLARRRAEWLPGCEDVEWMVGFRRGFAETVEIAPGKEQAFADRAAHLFSLAPIQAVSLDPTTHDALRTIADVPELRHVRRLCVPYLDPTGLSILLRSPHLGGLRELDLNKGRLGEEGVTVLLETPLTRQVTSLSLGGRRDSQDYDWDEVAWTDHTVENVGEAGVLVLAASPRLKGLRRLDLSWNRLGPTAATALIRSPHLGSLEELRLAERGSVEHDGIHKTSREEPSPLPANAVRALRERFGATLRVPAG